MICTSIVLEHSNKDAQRAFGREFFERWPFDTDAATRTTALSYSQDALSTLDFIEEALEDSGLDPYEQVDCIRALVRCHGAFDKLREVAAEWSLASAIEARSDATGTGAAEGESAVPNGETPE